MIIFVVFFFVLLLYGISLNKTGYNEAPLNYKNMIALRGICAVEIVIGHIGVVTKNPWLFINRKAGVLIVGIFLFLSGYGLMKSLQNKMDYMNGFLKNRILKLLIPALIVYIIYYGMDILSGYFAREIYTITLKYIFLWQFPQKINWYVTELLGLYLLYYVLYKSFKIKVANILIVIICLIVVFVMWKIGMGNPWYGSTLCFPLGILYAQCETKMLQCVKERYFRILGLGILFVSVGIFMFFKLSDYSFVSNVLGRNVATIAFCIVMIVFSLRVRIDNPIINYFGTISYELFLVHEIFIFHERNDYSLKYNLVAFVFSILAAIVLHKINVLLQNRLWRKQSIDKIH